MAQLLLCRLSPGCRPGYSLNQLAQTRCHNGNGLRRYGNPDRGFRERHDLCEQVYFCVPRIDRHDQAEASKTIGAAKMMTLSPPASDRGNRYSSPFS